MCCLTDFTAMTIIVYRVISIIIPSVFNRGFGLLYRKDIATLDNIIKHLREIEDNTPISLYLEYEDVKVLVTTSNKTLTNLNDAISSLYLHESKC